MYFFSKTTIAFPIDITAERIPSVATKINILAEPKWGGGGGANKLLTPPTGLSYMYSNVCHNFPDKLCQSIPSDIHLICICTTSRESLGSIMGSVAWGLHAKPAINQVQHCLYIHNIAIE